MTLNYEATIPFFASTQGCNIKMRMEYWLEELQFVDLLTILKSVQENSEALQSL